MNSRIVFFTLISTLLLLALVVEASATTRTVGVSVGNKFRYSPTVSWSSNDTSATPPPDLVDANNTQWGEVTVTGISGTNITTQITNHYKNGTEATPVSGWKDVNTGAGNMSIFVISANLTTGDSVFTSSSWIINETVPRTYSGVKRDTNHLNMTLSSGTQITGYDFYWDKSTGVLVETLQETTNQTGTYTTTWSEDLQIISSDVWIVPEFPTWTPALLMLIALTSATMVIAKQKQPKRPHR
jgi:hypothetical protein